MYVAKKTDDRTVNVYKIGGGMERSYSVPGRIVRVNIDGDEIAIAFEENDGRERVYVYKIDGGFIRSY